MCRFVENGGKSSVGPHCINHWHVSITLSCDNSCDFLCDRRRIVVKVILFIPPPTPYLIRSHPYYKQGVACNNTMKYHQ